MEQSLKDILESIEEYVEEKKESLNSLIDCLTNGPDWWESA